MKVAYHLAMAGLDEAFREQAMKDELRLYEEYETLEWSGSVSAPKAKVIDDSDMQLGLELDER